MEGQPRQPETDCFSPAKAAQGFDLSGPTTISDNPSYANGGGLPLNKWPNLTASAFSLAICYKVFNATSEGDSLRETLLKETSVMTIFKPDYTQFALNHNHTNRLIKLVPNTCVADGLEYDVTQFMDIQRIRDKIHFIYDLPDIYNQKRCSNIITNQS